MFWTLFLPSRREEVEAKVESATLVHLWSEAIRWSGYDVSVCPPEGSYLHARFAALGALERFVRTADEEEVLRVMANPIRAAEAPLSSPGA